MSIEEALTDAQVAACFPVMVELRPHLVSAAELVVRVRVQQAEGYRLVLLRDGEIRAVAGFRRGRNLAWGDFVYVDDLAVAPTSRDQGYGSRLLNWITDWARAEGCLQVHLNSGVQRFAAHGFYLRHHFAITSHHFARSL